MSPITPMDVLNDLLGDFRNWLMYSNTFFVVFILLLTVLVVLAICLLIKHLRAAPPRREGAPLESLPLGEALKARRTAAGYTQEYVAEALGVSRQAVSKWENGTSEPSTANLMALAKLYGLSVDELLHTGE